MPELTTKAGWALLSRIENTGEGGDRTLTREERRTATSAIAAIEAEAAEQALADLRTRVEGLDTRYDDDATGAQPKELLSRDAVLALLSVPEPHSAQPESIEAQEPTDA